MNLTGRAIHAVRSPDASLDLQRRQLPILRLVGIGSDRAEIAARIQPLLYGARPWGPADYLLRDFPACQNCGARRSALNWLRVSPRLSRPKVSTLHPHSAVR